MYLLEERLAGKQSVAILDNFWGDGGKGAWIDYLLSHFDFDMVVRFGGGDNAGHTIKVGDAQLISHLVPSMQFNPKVKGVIANGVVVNLEGLFKEIDELKERGIDLTGRLFISGAAHVIADYHREADSKDKKVGTTGKGIGPAYADKALRTGVRVNDVFDIDWLKKEHEQFYNYFLKKDVFGRLSELLRMTTNTQRMITEAYDKGERILFEGAQGALLDIDHGTYPFVTSSNPTSGGIATGTGIFFKKIDHVFGIVKAYTTRVGNGPFPSEFDKEEAHRLREIGKEYGATTGRPRRIGALDLVALRYASERNGNDVLITKLDCLDSYDKIPVCVGYRYTGPIIQVDGHWLFKDTELNHLIAEPRILEHCKPIIEYMPGWKQPITDVRGYSGLPKEARDYLEAIEKKAGVRICGVSVGPEREQKIVK